MATSELDLRMYHGPGMRKQGQQLQEELSRQLFPIREWIVTVRMTWTDFLMEKRKLKSLRQVTTAFEGYPCSFCSNCLWYSLPQGRLENVVEMLRCHLTVI
jgi:hypothetical protein